MNNIPRTAATEIGEAINALIAGSDRFRDLNSAEIQSLFRAIEKLQKVDARQAFVHFGVLSAICGDEEGLFTYFRKALLLPGEVETKHEFWISLANAGLYEKAREVGSWLLDPRRGFFPKVWQRAVCLGEVLEVFARVDEAKRTFPELRDVDFSKLEDAVSVMLERGLTDDHIISVLALMGEIQRKHRIMFAGESVSVVRVMRPPDDPPYLYLAVPLDADVTEIHAMNRELAGQVVERLPDGIFPPGMVASFAKAQRIALRAAA